MNRHKSRAAILSASCIALGAWTFCCVTPADDSKKPESSSDTAFSFPRINDYGKVVRLPDAADQPRDGAKICVDITADGAPDRIHPAIEKVARFVNIYAGAGKQPASARVTVILHGKATLTALNHEAYARQFQTKRNPNAPLFAKLKDAGVEILVCGQSLAQKGGGPADVANQVRVAVSALTVNVNRQADGYAFIPLR